MKIKKQLKQLAYFSVGLVLSYGLVTNFSNTQDQKADLFDSIDDGFDDVIYDGEASRALEPTFSFLPENKVILSNYDSEKKIATYYTLDTPDNVVELAVDNVTSNPHCPYGWKYKFQGHSKYFKLGEAVTDIDASPESSNYPVLQAQDGTNKNYKINVNRDGAIPEVESIKIFFDKNIKNAQHYFFNLANGIQIYSDYKNGEELFDSICKLKEETKIEGKALTLKLSGCSRDLAFDDMRIVISKNLISDTDGRIAPNDIVVGDKVIKPYEVEEYVIDNKNPAALEPALTTTGNLITAMTVFFSEPIFEKEGVDPLSYLKYDGKMLDASTEVNVESNKIDIFFYEPIEKGKDFEVLSGAFVDKVGNENEVITYNKLGN